MSSSNQDNHRNNCSKGRRLSIAAIYLAATAALIILTWVFPWQKWNLWNWLSVAIFIISATVCGGIIHAMTWWMDKNDIKIALRSAFFLGFAGPLLLYALLYFSTDRLAIGFFAFSAPIWYFSFFMSGFIIIAIVLQLCSVFSKDFWKKFTIPGFILFFLFFPPTATYIIGQVGLAWEIKGLQKQWRPISWNDFYRKYPVSDAESPAAKIMQQVLKISASLPQSWSISENNDNATAVKITEFHVLMRQLLDLPPLTWEIHDSQETESRAFGDFKQLEYQRLKNCLKTGDYLRAAEAMTFLRKANIISMRNTDWWICSDFREMELLLNSHKIPESILRQWLTQYTEEEKELEKARIRSIDLYNVEIIVKPEAISAGHGLSSFRTETLPLPFKFLVPAWKWRQLVLNRHNETMSYAEAQYRRALLGGTPSFIALYGVFNFFDGLLKGDRFWDNLLFSFWFNRTDGMNSYFYDLTEIRMVRAAVALELYFTRHGKLPEDLSVLRPEFLPEIPIDPITCQPLQYCLHEDGKGEVYSKKINRSIIICPTMEKSPASKSALQR